VSWIRWFPIRLASDKKEGKPINKAIVATIQVAEIKLTERIFFQKLNKPPVKERRLKEDYTQSTCPTLGQ